MLGLANNEANRTRESDDSMSVEYDEHDTFLTIPQIKAREILRAYVVHNRSKKMQTKRTVEHFESVIKPLLMSSVESFSRADADDASLRKYYIYLTHSDSYPVQLQHERDGWQWAIHNGSFDAKSSQPTHSKRHHEKLRCACDFPETPDPHECYSKFVLQMFLDTAVISSTNRAARCRPRLSDAIEAEKWQDLDTNEFMTWIGILELMLIAEPSSGCLQHYWRPDAFNFGTMSIQFNFSNHMSHHRWLQILQHLNFDGDISELFDAFNQKVEKTIIPGQVLSVCQLSRFEINHSSASEDWMCLCDMSTNVIMRLPSSSSRTRHWSEQVRDANAVSLLGLTQPYHFSLREVLFTSSQCEVDAITQLHKRGITGVLVSDNTPGTLPPFYPVDILKISLTSAQSCLICDRSFSGTNVRIFFQQLGSCAFCTNDSSLNGSQNDISVSNSKQLSKSLSKMSLFQSSVENHINLFTNPIRLARIDSSDYECFEKMSALIRILAIVEWNAKALYDSASSIKDSPLLQFRARLANKLLSGPTSRSLHPHRDNSDILDGKKRRIARSHRIIRLDNSTAQVQRQCSLACRCANKKSPKDPAPRTSNACSCSPSVPLCSKVCHTYHVLSQLDLHSELEAGISESDDRLNTCIISQRRC
jgi:hypothetical protein